MLSLVKNLKRLPILIKNKNLLNRVPNFPQLSVNIVFRPQFYFAHNPNQELFRNIDQQVAQALSAAAEGDFQYSLNQLQSALEVVRQKVGPKTDLEVFIQVGIAESYCGLQEYNKALESLGEASQLVSEGMKIEPYLTSRLARAYGLVYYELGQAEESVKWYQKALESVDKRKSPEDEEYYISKELGKAYARNNQFDKAHEVLKKAQDYYANRSYEFPDELEDTYQTLGQVYQFMGEWKKSFETYSKAVELITQSQGEGHPSLAKLYWGIGEAHLRQGEQNKALENYEKAHILFENYGDFPSLIDLNNDIGKVYLNTNPDKALSYFQKALEYGKKAYGEESPALIMTYSNLGTTLFQLDKIEDAKKYIEKAVRLGERAYGPNNPALIGCYNALGSIYSSQSPEKAIEYLKKAEAIQSGKITEENPENAKVFISLALIHSNKGDNDKAMEYFYKALDVLKTTATEDNPGFRYLYWNMASVLKQAGRHQGALDAFKKFVELQEKYEKVPIGEDVNNDLGYLCFQLQRYDEALEYFEKEQERLCALDKEDSVPEYASVIGNIGSIYRVKQNYPRATVYLESATKLFEKKKDEFPTETAAFFVELGKVYLETGDKAKSDELMNKAKDIFLSKYKK